MAVYRTYECPSCFKCFDYLHHPNDEPPPNFCPLCGADVSGRKKKKMKNVDRMRSPRPPVHKSGGRPGIASKSVDMVYRGMENAAESRIQDAADILGVDRSTLNSMKFTNMRDNARMGEQSNIPASAAQIMGAPTIVPGVQVGQMQFQQNQQAVEYAKDVGKGPDARAGKVFRDGVVSGHQMRAAQVARAGQLNKK